MIASHSSLRYFVPGFHRNMDGDMVAAVADGGGVVQINFGSGFVSRDVREWTARRDAAMLARFAGGEVAADTRRELMEAYAAGDPDPFATVDTVLDHIDRWSNWPASTMSDSAPTSAALGTLARGV